MKSSRRERAIPRRGLYRGQDAVKTSDDNDLERKIRVLVRGLDRAQRMGLLAVLPRLHAGQQIIKN